VLSDTGAAREGRDRRRDLQSAHSWNAINDRPLNHYSFGAMGLASSHGLGLALGLPSRRIIVLDGDGSLLMNLGSLVTIAAAARRI